MVPGVALLDAQRPNIINLVGGLYDVEAFGLELWGILAEPINELN